MLTITITIEERPGQDGPARKVDLKLKCRGFASQAEQEYAEHFKPLMEQIMGAKVVTGKSAKPS